MKTAKIDWVFWIEIKRRHWFKNFWTTRGANFYEIQIFGLRISIGMPWEYDFAKQVPDSYCSHANSENLKSKFSILIKRKAN